jgi:hypothetical protein
MSIKSPSSSYYLNKMTVTKGLLEHLANRQSIGKLASRCAAPESLNSISNGSSHGYTTKEHGVERTTTDSSLNQLEKKFRIKSSCKILDLTRDAAPKAVLSVGVANVRSPEIKKSGLSESARSDLEKKNLLIISRDKIS